MVLIQLLLPISALDTGADRDTRLSETARELGDAFGGLTAYVRSPAKGLWTSPGGHTQEDEVVMVEVVTKRFDRSWWKQYSATLETRFGQDVIHVRALTIEVLDPEALVRFSVRPYAPPESVSKRAPSTTRPSLHF